MNGNTKLTNSHLMVIEVCRTATAWARVYKNRAMYTKGKMFFETRSVPLKYSDMKVAACAAGILVDAYWIVRMGGFQRHSLKAVLVDTEGNEQEIIIVI